MKLNLYKCSAKDREWYSLAESICKGAIPLACGGNEAGGWPYYYDVPPEKIEFFKEVEVDLSQFVDAKAASIKQQLEAKTKELAELRESMTHLVWRLWFK